MSGFRIRQAKLTGRARIVAMDQLVFSTYGPEEDPEEDPEEEPEIISARLEVFPEGCAILENGDNNAWTSQLMVSLEAASLVI